MAIYSSIKMSKKLYNSLVDFVILAGFDQDTGLVMIDGQVRISFQKAHSLPNKLSLWVGVFKYGLPNQTDTNDLFKTYFEPSILAVISSDTANYPRSNSRYNLAYPTLRLTKEQSVGISQASSCALPIVLFMFVID